MEEDYDGYLREQEVKLKEERYSPKASILHMSLMAILSLHTIVLWEKKACLVLKLCTLSSCLNSVLHL